jgi:ADP-ribose pyrophosphatase
VTVDSNSDLEEKTMESTLVYSGKIVTLRVDRVLTPNGKYAMREVVEHPGAVCVVPMIGNDVILVEQYRHPAGQILLEIPAGKIEDGEDPEQCAIRELQEEVGYEPSQLRKVAEFYTSPGIFGELMHLYLASELVPHTTTCDEDEFLRIKRIGIDEAYSLVVNGTIKDAKTIVGLLMAKSTI